MVVSRISLIYNYLWEIALSVSLQIGLSLVLLSEGEGLAAMEKEVEVIKAQKVMLISRVMHV